jgi:hypothetical protein
MDPSPLPEPKEKTSQHRVIRKKEWCMPETFLGESLYEKNLKEDMQNTKHSEK